MPKLHDAGYRSAIQTRIRQLRPDSQRRWGKMSVGQMLWHVNEGMETALGRVQLPLAKAPLPRPLMKFIVINIPWPKGAPTLPKWVAEKEYDFAAERERCLRLIDELAAKSIEDDWPSSPMLGRMSGTDVTRLHAKHLNHHLTQFGV
jgi:hypothetical protein